MLVIIVTCAVAATLCAQGPGFRGGRGAGRGGAGPDDTFVADRDDFHYLLAHHEEVRREVKELEKGVETITESDNPAVAAIIHKHVAAMYQRVEQQRPIRGRDPLFAEVFRHADKIKMELQKTPKGVRVIETSDDEYVARLIKAHAKVVTGFVQRGFDEAHKIHAVPGSAAAHADSLVLQSEMENTAFVDFDRVYIPALALTNQMKQPAASIAVERLSKAWDERFVGRFHRMFQDDVEWPGDVSRIAQAIALAQSELSSGEPVKAHEKLEAIRDILTEARRRNSVEYPLDTLSEFHATMEAIVKPAMKADVATLSSLQIEQLSVLAKQADAAWQIVEQTPFDLAAFGKSEQQQQFRSMLMAERRAIDKLSRALAEGDKQAILQAAKGIKPPFAQVYMFFGDFPREADASR
jgi:hypothetical protein